MRFLEWISTFVNENVLDFIEQPVYTCINEFKLNQINWNALQLDFLWNVLEGKNNNKKTVYNYKIYLYLYSNCHEIIHSSSYKMTYM